MEGQNEFESIQTIEESKPGKDRAVREMFLEDNTLQKLKDILADKKRNLRTDNTLPEEENVIRNDFDTVMGLYTKLRNQVYLLDDKDMKIFLDLKNNYLGKGN